MYLLCSMVVCLRKETSEKVNNILVMGLWNEDYAVKL